jgi:hypothetical protein
MAVNSELQANRNSVTMNPIVPRGSFGTPPTSTFPIPTTLNALRDGGKGFSQHVDRYVHVVLTLPREHAPLALQNKRLIYNLLFHASAETLLEIARDPASCG